MNRVPLAIFLCLAFGALGYGAQRKIAYSRGQNIFVADVDGTHSKKLTEGAWPAISPDGSRVAF
jgi:Tol biopolymer transport system component